MLPGLQRGQHGFASQHNTTQHNTTQRNTTQHNNNTTQQRFTIPILDVCTHAVSFEGIDLARLFLVAAWLGPPHWLSFDSTAAGPLGTVLQGSRPPHHQLGLRQGTRHQTAGPRHTHHLPGPRAAGRLAVRL